MKTAQGQLNIRNNAFKITIYKKTAWIIIWNAVVAFGSKISV